MTKSANLQSVEKAIQTLRIQFLPRKFDPLGNYSNPAYVQARTRAFIVLAHAEIEYYFEIWAKYIAQAAERLWNSAQKVSTPMAYLLATLGEKVTTAKLFPKDTPQRFMEECNALFNRFYKQIKDNHGVKEANILTLLGALGTPATAFGTTLLPSLDSFGENRGFHAHHATRAVVNALDPEMEFNKALDLLVELEPLDVWLQTYLASII